MFAGGLAGGLVVLFILGMAAIGMLIGLILTCLVRRSGETWRRAVAWGFCMSLGGVLALILVIFVLPALAGRPVSERQEVPVEMPGGAPGR